MLNFKPSDYCASEAVARLWSLVYRVVVTAIAQASQYTYPDGSVCAGENRPDKLWVGLLTSYAILVV